MAAGPSFNPASHATRLGMRAITSVFSSVAKAGEVVRDIEFIDGVAFSLFEVEEDGGAMVKVGTDLVMVDGGALSVSGILATVDGPMVVVGDDLAMIGLAPAFAYEDSLMAAFASWAMADGALTAVDDFPMTIAVGFSMPGNGLDAGAGESILWAE